MAILKKEDVGADISALCTKCKIETQHTVASKVGEKIGKVRCRECGSTHRHVRRGVRSASRKSAKLAPEEIWNRCMENASSKKKVAYTLSGFYKLNDVIDHSHFGLGVVTLLWAQGKIQVTFKEGEKLLIMGSPPSSRSAAYLRQ